MKVLALLIVSVFLVVSGCADDGRDGPMGPSGMEELMKGSHADRAKHGKAILVSVELLTALNVALKDEKDKAAIIVSLQSGYDTAKAIFGAIANPSDAQKATWKAVRDPYDQAVLDYDNAKKAVVTAQDAYNAEIAAEATE